MTDTLGTLYIVATPIGNLEDITFRAVRVLKEVDLILCEDTRTSKTLFKKYDISTRTSSYHAHSDIRKHQSIIDTLLEGKSIALVSDAGTPGISDPGSLLVSLIRTHHPDIDIIPVPGPSAVSALVSISGFTGNEFSFLGFVPHKKGRETFFQTLKTYAHPVVFYESCHRIMKTLESLMVYDESHIVCIGREMTKKFETYTYGSITQAFEAVGKNTQTQKGEFTIMMIPRKK